jgi:hypothetical protein
MRTDFFVFVGGGAASSSTWSLSSLRASDTLLSVLMKEVCGTAAG